MSDIRQIFGSNQLRKNSERNSHLRLWMTESFQLRVDSKEMSTSHEKQNGLIDMSSAIDIEKSASGRESTRDAELQMGKQQQQQKSFWLNSLLSRVDFSFPFLFCENTLKNWNTMKSLTVWS